ncbi:hypothetical protein A0H81_09694 [Grifola frondosa]|uniref:DH domain-containing protein n=1 Tax=Grifola frondosa TaxID=5627 RepID=A0A1C7LZS4_GRIFR|nr:hypothetical protein A0H81_09694 [Grifola frondosa]
MDIHAPHAPPKGAVLPHRVHKSRSRTRSGARPASIAALRAPASPHERVRGPARRRSLPDLQKPLPATPKPLPPAPPDRMVALLPSLSRRAPPPCESALLHGDEETEKGERERDRGRKLFILDADDGEASDREEQEQVSFKERRARVASMIDSLQREQERAAERDRERQREERARARRYHALLELLTTEVGYLTDLRALVTIYLDQLLALTTFRQTATPHHSPSSTPQPSPGRPAPSLSALSMTGLSLARTFPASRSSFLNPSPAPSPSPAPRRAWGIH